MRNIRKMKENVFIADEVMQTCVIKPIDESRNAFAAFHFCLRNMVKELLLIGDQRVDEVLARHNVTFTDVEGIKRLAVEFPDDVVEDFQIYWKKRGGQV